MNYSIAGLSALLLAMAGARVTSLAAQGPSAIPVVTLEEARRRAAVVNPGAVAARSDVGAASWERRAALLDLVTPNITAAGGYTRFSEPFFNFGTGGVSPNATSVTVEARYTLIGGGKLAGLKRSAASLASAEAAETATNYRTALQTEDAYFAVLAEHDLTRVAADRLRRATEQFAIARARVLAGEAIAPDSLQLLLEMNRARLDMLRRDSALTVSRLALGRRIGVSGPVEAAADSITPGVLPFSLETAVSEMGVSGPELVAARAAERQAGAVLNQARESYLPQVVIGATTGAYDSKLFPSGVTRSQLTVGVSWPIWNGAQREMVVARAGANSEAARAQRADAERAAGEQMAAAYHGYETSRSAIDLAATGVTLAAETYRVQSARYREGATTILDLLESQVALSEAETTLIQSRYAARLALAEIEALLGRRIQE